MLLTTAFCPPLAYFALLSRDMTLSPDRVSPSEVWLEACERYQKQSYRNRCYILAGDGVQMLQVPVVHSAWMGIREVQVDWSTPWLVRMQRALDAAYYTSAYYEYYRDDLFAVMDRRPMLLWDWNLSLLRFLAERASVACTLRETTSFAVPEGSAGVAATAESPGGDSRSEVSGGGSAGFSAEVSDGVPGGHPTVASDGASMRTPAEVPAGAYFSGGDDYRYVIHPKRPDTVLRDLGLERPYYQVFSNRFGFTPGLSVLDLLFNEGPDAILWLKRLG